jgi:outer membrane lipoprotein SlyB
MIPNSSFTRCREPLAGSSGQDGRANMMRTAGATVFLMLAALTPAQQAAAQDPLAGAIIGGALGGIVGGALGRGGGAIAGAAIGATTGAIIAAEAQRNAAGYYWWHGGCYYRYPNGAWFQVQPGYCSY